MDYPDWMAISKLIPGHANIPAGHFIIGAHARTALVSLLAARFSKRLGLEITFHDLCGLKAEGKKGQV